MVGCTIPCRGITFINSLKYENRKDVVELHSDVGVFETGRFLSVLVDQKYFRPFFRSLGNGLFSFVACLIT